MNISTIRAATLVATLSLISSSLSAAHSVLSGRLHGTEPEAVQLSNDCDTQYARPDYARLGYDLVTPLTVSESGGYNAASANWNIGLDAYFAIYEGAFDPQHPERNLLGHQDYEAWWRDEPVSVTLQKGVEYQLLASSWCVPAKGTWTIVFDGPGEVSSPATVTDLDEFRSGSFPSAAPSANIGCGSHKYHVSGAQRLARSGTYYLVDIAYFFGQGVCVGVYDRPFDASRPMIGQVALLHDYYQRLELASDRDYYFVVTPYDHAQIDYYYLLLPTGDVYIDPVLSGSWYDPETPGQGFFLDILSGHTVFLGWFTFDLERPEPNASPLIGDSGHRWLTAFGGFRDTEAVMAVTVTTGGVFNEAVPPATNHTGGQLSLRLFDCRSGEVSFDLGRADRSGTIPIERVSAEAASPCYALMASAGKPRRLMAD